MLYIIHCARNVLGRRCDAVASWLAEGWLAVADREKYRKSESFHGHCYTMDMRGGLRRRHEVGSYRQRYIGLMEGVRSGQFRSGLHPDAHEGVQSHTRLPRPPSLPSYSPSAVTSSFSILLLNSLVRH